MDVPAHEPLRYYLSVFCTTVHHSPALPSIAVSAWAGARPYPVPRPTTSPLDSQPSVAKGCGYCIPLDSPFPLCKFLVPQNHQDPTNEQDYECFLSAGGAADLWSSRTTRFTQVMSFARSSVTQSSAIARFSTTAARTESLASPPAGYEPRNFISARCERRSRRQSPMT